MIGKVFSGAILGLEGKVVEVESSVSFGLKRFEIVGLPDKAVEESKERVCLALENSGLEAPHQKPERVLISLAPADLKKEGSFYDLPIAVAYLFAKGTVFFNPKEKFFVGELSLKGELKKIRGALLFALLAKEKGFKEIILPKENEKEALLVKGIQVFGAKNLKEVIDCLEGKKKAIAGGLQIEQNFGAENFEIEISQVKGQEVAKRALEICAAGSHHLLMQGPPGTGKTLLAKSLISILPPLSEQEIFEVTKIYSVCGLLPEEKPLISQRPFRAPHHSISEAALIGGGNPLKPGEITLAHRGILFLDEFPEFHRDVLESLRQPLEEGEIVVSRTKQSAKFPAKFTLVAAANPCPCGFFGDPERNCRCLPSQVRMYQRKLSGPIVDRIDLFVQVPRVEFEKLKSEESSIETQKIRERVILAREIQKKRFSSEKTNSQMSLKEIARFCKVDLKSEEILKKAVNSGMLSARGYHKVLKVARTIADLEGKEQIKLEHILEALSFRKKEEI